MADNSNVVVSITGDASQVAPAVEETKSHLLGMKDTIAQLNANMVALAEAMKKGFGDGSTAAHGMKSALDETKHATEGETNALTAMIHKIHESAESVRTFQMRAKEFAEVYVAMFAVESIHEWAKSMGEAAENVKHLGQQFGMTSDQVQQLQGVAVASGVEMDALTRGMGILDMKLVTTKGSTGAAANAIKMFGISADDGRSNMERLAVISEKFQHLEPGKRAAAAMLIFGKSGRDLIPVLLEGRKGIEELARKTADYGGVSSEANKKGLELQESLNENKLAMSGISNVLMASFAPALKAIVNGLNELVKEFIKSYKEGGAAKVIMDLLAGTLKAVGLALEAAAVVFKPFGEAIEFVAKNIEIIAPIAAALAALMAGPFVVAFVSSTLATIAQTDAFVALQGAFVLDGLASALAYAMELLAGGFKVAAAATWEFTTALLANPLTWVALAVAAVSAGLVWLAMHTATVKDAFIVMKDVCVMALEWIKDSVIALGGMLVTLGKIAYDAFTLQWGSIQADWKAGLDGLASEVQAFDNKIKTLHDDMMKHLSFGGGKGAPDKPETPPVPTDWNPELGGTKKEKKHKEKKPKDDLVQKLEEELTAQKTAWDKEQDALGTAVAFKLETEKKFWNDALNLQNLSAKDRMSIQQKYNAVSKQLKAQEIAEQIEVYKSNIKEAEKNEEEKLNIMRKETAYLSRMHGAQSKEAAAARDAEVEQVKKAKEQKERMLEETHNLERKLRLMNVDDAVKAAQAEVALGRKTQAELIAVERDAITQKHQMDRQALEERLAMMINDPFHNPEEAQKLNDQLIELDRKFQSELTANLRQAEAERDKIKKGAIDSFSSSWASALSKLATLQQGFAATFKEMYKGMVQAVAGALQQMIQQWLVAHLAKLLIHKTENRTIIQGLAAQAGAGGVASMAAAPFPMDLTAPAFGTSMASTAAAFGAVPHAEGGWWDVQPGLANLHANEMVLPAWAAAPLRDMLGGKSGGAPAANFNMPGAANDGGDMHVHFHGAIVQNPAEMKRWFESNHQGVGAAVRSYVRQGGNTSTFR